MVVKVVHGLGLIVDARRSKDVKDRALPSNSSQSRKEDDRVRNSFKLQVTEKLAKRGLNK